MSERDENADKPFEPTQRKLDEARRKGEIAKSTDLFVTAAYGGLLIAAVTVGVDALKSTGAVLATLLDRPHEFAPLVFDGAPQATLGGWALALLPGFVPWFLLPVLAVLLMVLAQRAFTFAPSKLAFKPSRLSPIENAKQKYGRNGLFEFCKSFAKLLIYSVVLALFLVARLPEVAGALALEASQAVAVMMRLVLHFMALVLLIAAGIGGVDYLWQRAEFHRRNRMSFKEMRDEAKEAEGDPHLKQERRQRGQEIATNRMLGDVPGADVVIVNPTHYAVALRWSRMPGDAPECVAKGTDEIAARIREIAIENGVPIRHDPPTARALFATVEIGRQIDRDHFRAVAAAIRFAEAMRRKVARR